MSHGIVLFSSRSEALKSGIYFVFISILYVYSDKTLFMAYVPYLEFHMSYFLRL